MSVLVPFLMCLIGAICCAQISRSPVWGSTASTILNPPGILAIVVCVFAVDFLMLSGQHEIDAIARIVSISTQNVVHAFWWFTACFWAALLTMATCCWLASPVGSTSRPLSEKADLWFAWMFLGIALAAYAVAIGKVSSLIGGLWNLPDFLQFRFLYLKQSDLLQYLPAWVPVAVILLVMARGRLDFLAGLLLITGIGAALSFGFRDRLVLYVLAVLMVSRRLNLLCSYRFAPAGVLIAVIALTALSAVIRPQENLKIAEALDPTYAMARAFQSYEIAASKNLVLVFAGEHVERLPGQSLINMALLPVPREWLPGAKTFGANIEFTKELRGPVFSATLSATSLGGFGELYLEGPVYGLVAVAGLTAALTLVFVAAINHHRLIVRAFAPMVLWIEFHFIRTGVTELGLFLWLMIVPLVALTLWRGLGSVGGGRHI